MDIRKYNLSKLTRTCTRLVPKDSSPKKLKPINLLDMEISDIEKLVEKVVMGGYTLPSLVDKLLLAHYNNR